MRKKEPLSVNCRFYNLQRASIGPLGAGLRHKVKSSSWARDRGLCAVFKKMKGCWVPWSEGKITPLRRALGRWGQVGRGVHGGRVLEAVHRRDDLGASGYRRNGYIRQAHGAYGRRLNRIRRAIADNVSDKPRGEEINRGKLKAPEPFLAFFLGLALGRGGESKDFRKRIPEKDGFKRMTIVYRSWSQVLRCIAI